MPLVNLADASVLEPVTLNQAQLRVWIKSNLDKVFVLQDSMINYVAKMLDDSKYTTADLMDVRLATYDPKDHEQGPGDRLPITML